MIREAIEELKDTKLEPGNVGLKGLTRRCTIYYGTPGSSAYKTACQFADFTYDLSMTHSPREVVDQGEFIKAVENGTSVIFDNAQYASETLLAFLEKFLTDDHIEVDGKKVKIDGDFKMIFVVTIQ